MTDLKGLRERVEAATGPSRELDWRIHALVNGNNWPHWQYRYEAEVDDVPRYTASIDTALALVEEVLPGWTYAIDASEPDAGIETRLFAPRSTDDLSGKGKSTPLALLAALLRALEAKP